MEFLEFGAVLYATGTVTCKGNSVLGGVERAETVDDMCGAEADAYVRAKKQASGMNGAKQKYGGIGG